MRVAMRFSPFDQLAVKRLGWKERARMVAVNCTQPS